LLPVGQLLNGSPVAFYCFSRGGDGMRVVSGEWCETCESVEPVAYCGALPVCDTCGSSEEDYEDGDE